MFALIIPAQKGFTLVEIMIAMLLGSILLMMSTQVLIQLAKSNRLAHQSLLMQEAGSLARQILETDIRKTGFFAGLNADSNISGSAAMVSYRAECLKDDEEFSRMLFPSVIAFDGLPKNFSCLSEAHKESDVLVLRYLQAVPFISGSEVDANKLYMRVSLNEGKLLKAKDRDYYSNTLQSGVIYGEYEVKTLIYYLRETSRQCSGKTARALFREYNNRDGYMYAEEVVSGIEQMQFQFLHEGILKNAKELENDDWEKVQAVSVDLLLVSECMEAHEREQKTFQLADVSVHVDANDAYLYEQQRFMINLRNREP